MQLRSKIIIILFVAFFLLSSSFSHAALVDYPYDHLDRVTRIEADDGSDSFDLEGDLLTYLWSFISVPTGSNVTDTSFTDPASSKPLFIPDVNGAYEIEMTITDGAHYDSDTVTINADIPNVAPNADAGHDQNVLTGSVVYLDAVNSNDTDNGPAPLTFIWSFDALPSTSALSDSDIIK